MVTMVTAEPAAGPPRRRPKNRKSQILAQARELFAERGFPNVSMSAIAESVGITAGALYRHFANKAVLLEEVMADTFAYLGDPLPQDSLEQALDEAIDKVIDHPYQSDLWSRESIYLPEDAREELRSQMRGWAHAFVAPLRKERDDLDAGQEELLAWALQSALAFLGSSATRTPPAGRRDVVRAACLALARADLVETGGPVPPREPGLTPVSTRERLLLAAMDLFGDRGFRETSMTAIGAAADVSGPNLYGYFDSKAAVLGAVYERGTHALWMNLDSALAEARTADEALDLLVAGQVRLSASWTRVRVGAGTEPEIEESTRAAQREYVAEWTALVLAVCPTLDPREARLRVLVALAVIVDLGRTPHVAAYDSFPGNAQRLALAVLTDGRSARG